MHSYISQQLQALRAQNPLVINLTNYVVMNNTANALLALGASPIMAHSRDEMSEMVNIGGSVVINIGTLDSVWIERMRFAIQQANEYAKPVVLDPVGCGASQLRTQTAREFCQLAQRLIVRGNASEIMALANIKSSGKGVDASDPSEEAVIAAQSLIAEYGADHVVISGQDDYVVLREQVYKLSNGSDLMPKVTGMGCSHTALTGAFAALDFTHAGLCATAVLGVAGELAAKQSAGPGSMQINLLDALYQLDEKALEARLECQLYEPK